MHTCLEPKRDLKVGNRSRACINALRRLLEPSRNLGEIESLKLVGIKARQANAPSLRTPDAEIAKAERRTDGNTYSRPGAVFQAPARGQAKPRSPKDLRFRDESTRSADRRRKSPEGKFSNTREWVRSCERECRAGRKCRSLSSAGRRHCSRLNVAANELHDGVHGGARLENSGNPDLL